jgi:hypothetical protein
MAIEGLLQKLKNDDEWLKEFWKGMEFIADFSEYMKRFTKDDYENLTTLLRKSAKMKKEKDQQKKDGEQEKQISKEYLNFCEDVYLNLVQIKLNTLKYLDFFLFEILMVRAKNISFTLSQKKIKYLLFHFVRKLVENLKSPKKSIIFSKYSLRRRNQT